jgi:formylmethanofuran dehydrogenase subunit D
MAPKDYPSFPIDRLLIEGKASGLSVAQEIYRLIGASGKFGIDAIDPKKYGDKVSRVHSIQHIFADEMVYAPDKAWADMVIDQVSVFPKGSHDDLCLVAGTQISTRRGSIPIEQILDDDEVITPLGWRRVTGHGFTGWRQVINVGPLTGTGNHPVFSLDSGFMRMDSISLEQLVRFNLCDLIRTIRQKSLISMDKPIEEWVERENTISLKQQEMLTERKPKGFMSRFGSTFQGWISQRVTKFITRTVIPSIAALKIWSAYRSACIAVCLKRLIQSDSLLIWNVLDHLQRLGILPQRGSNGIVSTPSKVSKSLVELGYLELKEQKNVFGAGIDLNINYQLESSALRDVVSNQVSSNAVKADIFIHDLRPVFNLSVEEAKCYYANGVLVHNCDAVSMGLRYLRDQGFALRRDESSLAREDDMRYVSPSANLPLYPT